MNLKGASFPPVTGDIGKTPSVSRVLQVVIWAARGAIVPVAAAAISAWVSLQQHSAQIAELVRSRDEAAQKIARLERRLESAKFRAQGAELDAVIDVSKVKERVAFLCGKMRCP